MGSAAAGARGAFGSSGVARGGPPRQIVSRFRSGQRVVRRRGGGSTPLQVSLNGKPDNPVGSRWRRRIGRFQVPRTRNLQGVSPPAARGAPPPKPASDDIRSGDADRPARHADWPPGPPLPIAPSAATGQTSHGRARHEREPHARAASRLQRARTGHGPAKAGTIRCSTWGDRVTRRIGRARTVRPSLLSSTRPRRGTRRSGAEADTISCSTCGYRVSVGAFQSVADSDYALPDRRSHAPHFAGSVPGSASVG